MKTLPVLEIKQLYKQFNKNVVLQNISFQLNKGEILFLLGASGCGKTTLLRAIAGFETIEQGEIWLKNRLISAQHVQVPTQSRHLGYVVQEGVLFPHLNVYRNIAYGLGNGKGKAPHEREKIENLMALTGIDALAERFPHQLSGGQQQRVALARALAPEPELILLDEPFSALDEHMRHQIRKDMLHALRQSGTSAVFVTHDRDEALRYADKIAVMQRGKILQIAPPRELYWSPNNLDTAVFIGDNIVLPATLTHNENYAECQIGLIPVQVKSRHNCNCRMGYLLLRPEQFSLSIQCCKNQSVIFEAEVKQNEFKGHATTLSLDVHGLEINLEIHFIPEIKVGERLSIQLNGEGLFFS